MFVAVTAMFVEASMVPRAIENARLESVRLVSDMPVGNGVVYAHVIPVPRVFRNVTGWALEVVSMTCGASAVTKGPTPEVIVTGVLSTPISFVATTVMTADDRMVP
jgi:hypothetical protein